MTVAPNNVRKPVTAASITDATTAGRGLLTAADAAAQRTLLSVYSTAEVDGLLSGLGALTAEDIDTLAEINAIITDANFATVATTGSYNDLTDKPTIPAAIASGTITPRDDDIDLSGGSIGDVITVQADGSLALSTPAGGAESPLTLTANNAIETPLTIQGAASQSAPLQRWVNAENDILVQVLPSGEIKGALINGIKLDRANILYRTQGLDSWWVGGGFGVSPGVGYTFATSTWPAAPGEFGIYREGFNHARLRTAGGTNCRLTVGTINCSDLPTSDPSVAGDLWNDNGTLKISAG